MEEWSALPMNQDPKNQESIGQGGSVKKGKTNVE